MTDPAPRVLPPLTTTNRPFWTGGADGRLLIQRCGDCKSWNHPPAESCPRCGGGLSPQAVSGRGTVFTYTVNEQQFHPDVPPPYVIAVIELNEQAELRLPSNIVNCDSEQLRCGLAVRVRFEQQGEYFVPLFEPAE